METFMVLLDLPTFVLGRWHQFNKKHKTCAMAVEGSHGRKHPEIPLESHSLFTECVGSWRPCSFQPPAHSMVMNALSGYPHMPVDARFISQHETDFITERKCPCQIFIADDCSERMQKF